MAATVRMCSRVASKVFRINSVPSSCLLRGPRLSTAAESNAESSKIETPAEDENSKALEALKVEKDKLTTDFAELQDKYKRALAETENVRQRMQKQIDDAKLFGIQGFCKDLLDVADILGKATETVPTDELANPHLKTLFDGLKMTEGQLHKVFTRHGLVPINPQHGDKFDPNVHEALFQSPSTDGQESGTISLVEKAGYKLHSRTLKPALVGVFK